MVGLSAASSLRKDKNNATLYDKKAEDGTLIHRFHVEFGAL